MPTLETGRVRDSYVAKVWNYIGGRQIDELKARTPVMGYREGDYFRLTGPVGGITKTQWLLVAPVTMPPPPVEPPAEKFPAEMYVTIEGETRVYVPR